MRAINTPTGSVGTSGRLRMTRVAAFTLIELLVVIGIIGLLAAIAIPAMGSARRQARIVVCQSNLRSLFQASLAFAAANKRELPIGSSRAEQPTNTGAMRVCVVGMVPGSGVADFQSGCIWKYLPGDPLARQQMFWCPEDGNEVGASGSDISRNLSYSWNDQIRASPQPVATVWFGHKLNAIERPSEKVCILEEVAPNDSRSVNPWTNDADRPSGRHGRVGALQFGTPEYMAAGRCNMVFFDGRVELVASGDIVGNAAMFTIP